MFFLSKYLNLPDNPPPAETGFGIKFNFIGVPTRLPRSSGVTMGSELRANPKGPRSQGAPKVPTIRVNSRTTIKWLKNQYSIDGPFQSSVFSQLSRQNAPISCFVYDKSL